MAISITQAGISGIQTSGNTSVTLSGFGTLLVCLEGSVNVAPLSFNLSDGGSVDEDVDATDYVVSNGTRIGSVFIFNIRGLAAGSYTLSYDPSATFGVVAYEVQGCRVDPEVIVAEGDSGSSSSYGIDITTVTANAALLASVAATSSQSITSVGDDLDSYVDDGDSYTFGAGYSEDVGSAGTKTATLNFSGNVFYGAYMAVALTDASNIVPVDVELTFSDVQSGSEVRVYEMPHPQTWRIDFDGVTDAQCDGTAIEFELENSGSENHYLWFDLDDGSSDPTLTGTGHEVDITTGDDDEDIAAAAQTVLNGLTNLTATVTGTVVTVTNAENAQLTSPFGTMPAILTVVQEGGAATSEIDGIESTSGDWVADVTVANPRRIVLQIMHVDYKFKRLEYVIGRADASVPAGALQVEDLVYDNPS